MLDNQLNYGDMEDETFGLGETASYGFMNSEDEDFDGEGFSDGFGDTMGGDTMGGDGFGDFEAFGTDSFGDSYDQFDGEGEEFLGGLWKAAKKVGKVVAPLAKKFAPQIGGLIGGALGGPAGAAIGGKLGGFVQSLEGEDEGETEDELNAQIAVPRVDESLSEAMAVAAAKAKPNEAQSLGSALTISIASRAPMPVKAVLPVLAKASGDVARSLASSSDPRARVLIRTLPAIQKRTIATLTRKVQNGKPVTPRTAVRVMARHASRTLGNPQAIAAALANNAQKKRSLDKAAVQRAERFY